jgi:hypothetical protein
MLKAEVEQVHNIAKEAVKPLSEVVNELLARVEKLEKAVTEKPVKGVKDAKL